MLDNQEIVMPKVGMGVTEYSASDRTAYTITKVISYRRLEIQEDEVQRVDKNGLSEDQTWSFETNPKGEKIIITLRATGQDDVWKQFKSKSPNRFVVGERSYYRDPSY